MGRFNLLDEPWISVVVDRKGTVREISLKKVFEEAHLIRGLAGDMRAQDFAILRLLLAVMHTVFSRVDVDGNPHPGIFLKERWIQDENVPKNMLDKYGPSLFQTWKRLWNRRSCPKCVIEYLEMWRDSFFLFDENRPFYQVTKDVLEKGNPSKAMGSEVFGKNVNRLISESRNKVALFSPKTADHGNKEKLTDSQLARWLVMFQGYCGEPDKAYFGEEKYMKNTKGWLFELGGIYAEGDTLFETLLLNLVLVPSEKSYVGKVERPAWERTGEEIVLDALAYRNTLRTINNIAELYTLWSRAIYIDPETDMKESFSFRSVKLPAIRYRDYFFEPMTLWIYNKKNKDKNHYTARKHTPEQALWRSFGLLADYGSTEENQVPPGIVSWLRRTIVKKTIQDHRIRINAVGMEDKQGTPISEIYDGLSVSTMLLTDIEADKTGWENRITKIVEMTNEVIGWTYRSFMSEMKVIRNLSNENFVSSAVEELYYKVDKPFRLWISSIEPGDSMEKKEKEWRITLKKLVKKQVDEFVRSAGPRDYIGIIEKGGEGNKEENAERVRNIATAYNTFSYFLNRKLNVKEGSGGKSR